MRILLDVDGVLADWLTPALEVIAKETGKVYLPTDLLDWNLTKLLNREGFNGNRVLQSVFQQVRLHKLELLPGSLEAVRELRTFGDVYLVTSAPDIFRRSDWMDRNLNLPRSKLIYAMDKFTISGDVFVDDREDHVQSWMEHNPAGMGFLFRQPYNRFSEHLQGVGWGEILEAVRSKCQSR